MRSLALRISLRKVAALFVERLAALVVQRVGESLEDAQRPAQVVAGRAT